MSQPARLACWAGAGREGRTPAAKRCPHHRWPASRTRGGRPGRLNAGASLTTLYMWKIARPKESPCRFLSLGVRAFSTGRAVFDYRGVAGEMAIVAANTGSVELAYGGRREASPRCQLESLCCWALLLQDFLPLKIPSHPSLWPWEVVIALRLARSSSLVTATAGLGIVADDPNEITFKGIPAVFLFIVTTPSSSLFHLLLLT